MEDKKVIITEDNINLQPKIDIKIKDEKERIKEKIGLPNSSIFEMYQKYSNISMERDHVLTLRRGK